MQQDSEVEVRYASFEEDKPCTSESNQPRGLKLYGSATNDELVALTEHKKVLNSQLKKMHGTLSESVLHEHKCQRNVEKQQMLIDFHRSRAEAVNAQISKLSKELRSHERAAWDAHVANRERRMLNAQKRGGKAMEAERTYIKAPRASGERLRSSRSSSHPAVDGLRCATPPVQHPPTAQVEAKRNSLESTSSTAKVEKLELLLPPCPVSFDDSPQLLTPMAEAEEEVALSRVRFPKTMPQITGQTLPSGKRATLFWRTPSTTSLDSLGKPSPFREGTTLLDWFENSEECPNSSESSRVSANSRQKRSRERRANTGFQALNTWEAVKEKNKKLFRWSATMDIRKKENQPKDPQLYLEMMRDLGQEQEDETKAENAETDEDILLNKWLDQEMGILHRQSKVQTMEEKQLGNRLRAEVAYALEESAGSTRAAFNALDQNQSGQVSMNEFEGGIRALGVQWQEITGFKKVRDLFRLFDQEKKGNVTYFDVFPYDLQSEVDPMRLSTDDFWQYWCKRNRDVSPTIVRSAIWQPKGPEEELANIARSRKYKEDSDEKKKKMRVQIHNLKHHGKSDARCRELVALHLPKGTGPMTIDEIPTFSESDVQACRKTYTDNVAETSRRIEKTVGVMHDQRTALHKAKQQLWHTTEEPILRATKLEEQKALMTMGGIGGLFKKAHHVEDD